MKPLRSAIVLSSVVGLLALVASAVGLFWHGGGGAFDVLSIRGEPVRMFGNGVYRYDSLSMANVGLRLPTRQLMVYVGSFIFLALIAARLALRILGGMKDATTARVNDT